jgi:hypothetical protein
MRTLGIFTSLVGIAGLAAAGWIAAKSAPDVARYLRIRRM